MEESGYCGLLALAGIPDGDLAADAAELLRGQPPAEYNGDEQRLSVLVQRELDRLIVGGCDNMVLLRLFPLREPPAESEAAPAGAPSDFARQALRQMWPALDASAVRLGTLTRIATEAIGFFGPLHGGVVAQTAYPEVIVQSRRFTSAYPHINLERFDVYDAQTRAPVLGAWRARRLQNQRRETRLNRMIDTALLVLEVSQALFPRLIGA